VSHTRPVKDHGDDGGHAKRPGGGLRRHWGAVLHVARRSEAER
jgi:hypothetical protein